MALTDNGKTAYDAYNFDAGIRDRFDATDAIGNSQTQYVQEAAQRRLALAQAAEAERMAQAAAQGASQANKNNSSISNGVKTTGGITYNPGSNGPISNVNTGNASSDFNGFMQAISGQESGNNYSARNRDSGAMGKYQVMPGNISGSAGWDKEALGYNISTSQYMSSPQLQEQIASFKLKQYYDKYGPAGAAVAWYAGPGAAQRYVSSGHASTGSEGNYPTVSGYMQSILRRMGLA